MSSGRKGGRSDHTGDKVLVIFFCLSWVQGTQVFILLLFFKLHACYIDICYLFHKKKKSNQYYIRFNLPYDETGVSRHPTHSPQCKSYYYLSLLSDIKRQVRASLVAQWLRICLPMQGTRVQALVWEDPTCRRTTGPMSHNY